MYKYNATTSTWPTSTVIYMDHSPTTHRLGRLVIEAHNPEGFRQLGAGSRTRWEVPHLGRGQVERTQAPYAAARSDVPSPRRHRAGRALARLTADAVMLLSHSLMRGVTTVRSKTFSTQGTKCQALSRRNPDRLK